MSKKCIWIWVVLFSVVGPSMAHADASNPFKNGVTLSQFMRSQGIDPSRVDWFHIEPICAPMLSVSKEQYHRCRYEKAELSVLHASDKHECRLVAESDYPRSLRHDDWDSRYRYRLHGKLYRASYRTRGIDHRELEEHRRAGVVRCMKDLGWISATNWRLGQR